MFDFSWQNIIHSNTLNFLFLLIVLGWICLPKIRDYAYDKTKDTTDTINNSIETRKEALRSLDDAKSEYARVPQEAQTIKQTAENTLKSLEQKACEDTEKAKQTISNNSDKAIDNEASKTISELTKETAEKSISIALSDIQNKLQNDPSLHDKLIENSIDTLDVA